MSIDKVEHRLENWKRQLLDLTRRNKLLNYRNLKAGTVAIVDEMPQQVFRHLTSGKSFYFDPKPDEAGEVEAGEHQPSRNFTQGRPLTALTASELGDHHQDDRLQTTLDEQRLDHNLTTISRKTESIIEEKGVRTLFIALGMLNWHEAGHSEKSGKAPLILVPVELTRKTAADPFVLTMGEDEPILNPAIVEKLRLDFGIELPELPEMSEELDLDQIFQKIRDAVSGFDRWKLTSDIALGNFSFQKFIMYRDLERHEERFREHPVIRSLCREDDEAERVASLPPEITEADLDEEMSPSVSAQVLDADSTQQQAMLAVKKGEHLVIEGPPGTGKSQTIANLIADALHDGKTVLFVAEKRAALEVVQSRLEHEAGLGDHILELHSDKTSKRQFVEEIMKTLDHTDVPRPTDGDDLSRLESLTGDLKDYVIQLHEPIAPLAKSPYQAIAELADLGESVPRIDAHVPEITAVAPSAYDSAVRKLDDLAHNLERIGDPRIHPLRGIEVKNAGRQEQATIGRAIEAAGAAILELAEAANHLADRFGLRVPQTFHEADVAAEAARTLAYSPGADIAVLENSAWNEISPDAQNLLELGRRYQKKRQFVQERFRPQIIEEDTTNLVAEYATHLKKGFWRFAIPRHWTVRSQLRAYLSDTYQPENAESLLADLREAEECRADLHRLQESADIGASLFGARWAGPRSDWEDLEQFSKWVVEFRRYAVGEVLNSDGIQLAAQGAIKRDEAELQMGALREALEAARSTLDTLREAGAFSDASEITTDPEARIGRLAARIAEIESALDDLRPYSLYVQARDEARGTIARDYVDAAIGDLEPRHLQAGFRRLFYEQWLDEVGVKRPALATFDGLRHNKKIQTFRRLDKKSTTIARERTRLALSKRRNVLIRDRGGSQLQILQREARKRRRIMPVRKLISRTAWAVQQIKPCFMMSPLSVAQYVNPADLTFDLIVFDEASQIPPADAVGAIIRAKQVVVVGDSKQLPPTSFFGAQHDAVELDEEDDEELTQLEDMESILDDAATSGIPSHRLKWHYRSQHQSLIRFSNEEFYSDDPLYVFPAARSEDDSTGLKFEYVDNGLYEGRGQNTVEARQVAAAVVNHIKNCPELSLGVGTFGTKQRQVIMDEIDRLRREHPSIEWFFHQEGENKFFVKNLENIQGDDRDVIFLSVTYGPDADGRVNRNFGPINQDGGWRRLNVLTTRAKRRLHVFSSMRSDQIDVEGVAHGAQLLRQYLQYAETGEYSSAKITGGGTESPFEAGVKRALERRGYRVVSQVGDAGYRIDLAIVDQERPGRYICGIECDGATYHSAATVRDRDRLRQQVLELRGWTIHRVWSTDWFHDPKGQIERLVQLIDDTKRRVREPARQERFVKSDVPDSEHDETGQDLSEEETLEPERTPLEEIDLPLYEFAPVSTQGNSEAFYTASPTRLAKVTTDILEVEAPIHLNELARRVAACWQIQRTGSQVRRRIERTLERMARNDELRADGEFVWLNNGDPIKARSRAIDGHTFSSDEIPPVEIAEAVRVLLAHRAPLLPDEIVTETARLLGFSRTGRKLREQILAAKDQLISAGELRPGSRGIHLTKPVTSGD